MPRIEPSFSEHSHGFRPGRSAHGAVREARGYAEAGYQWVVDVDLEKFFDRVNHDVLMDWLAKRIRDTRGLGLIRRYLGGDIFQRGGGGAIRGNPARGPAITVVGQRAIGRGGQGAGAARTPVRTLCGRLQRVRGQLASGRTGDGAFAEALWAAAASGQRGQECGAAGGESIVSGLQLLVRAWKQGEMPGGRQEAMAAMKGKVRRLTWRTVGQGLGRIVGRLRVFLLGWKAYFRLAETPRVFQRLEQWIRHRLRALQLEQWKRGRTAYRALPDLGASRNLAAKIATLTAGTRRWWHMSHGYLHVVLTYRFFARMGLPHWHRDVNLSNRSVRTRMPDVWEGSAETM